MEELICLYVVDPRWFKASCYSHPKPIGLHRERFPLEALRDLNAGLPVDSVDAADWPLGITLDNTAFLYVRSYSYSATGF